MTDSELIRRLQGQSLVLLCAVRAMIATHPDKQAFLAFLRIYYGELQVINAAAGQPSGPLVEDARNFYESLCRAAETAQ